MLPIGPVEIRRPELRGDVCTLIGVVCHGHVGGELLLPVGQLVRMFGINVASELREQLDDRGDLHFTGEQFVNEGPVIRREIKLRGMPLDLEIASPLRGQLDRSYDRFTLHFAPGASFRVGRLVFEAELASLAVTADRVVLDFRPGLQLRVELTESPPAG